MSVTKTINSLSQLLEHDVRFGSSAALDEAPAKEIDVCLQNGDDIDPFVYCLLTPKEKEILHCEIRKIQEQYSVNVYPEEMIQAAHNFDITSDILKRIHTKIFESSGVHKRTFDIWNQLFKNSLQCFLAVPNYPYEGIGRCYRRNWNPLNKTQDNELLNELTRGIPGLK